MEAAAHEHNEKLDRVLNMLQAPGGASMRAKPADVIEWSDIAVREEMAVGAGGFGRVFLGDRLDGQHGARTRPSGRSGRTRPPQRCSCRRCPWACRCTWACRSS